MTSSFAGQICIVLVEPQSPGNIGMACRAMKNMGLRRLRIVKGCDHLHAEALKFAVSAKDLLHNAELFPDLPAALADCTSTVATTRRHGKYRQEILSPEECALLLMRHTTPDAPAAIVFGREDNGLTTEEISLCRWHATIPTSDAYGSLNLAQAVLIFCHELSRVSTNPSLTPEERARASSSDMEHLFSQMHTCLHKIGFLNEQNPEHIMRSLRRIFFRADLDTREIAILRGMLTQIDWASHDFGGRKRS